ncbi:reverse transcriptase [Penicillium alfredii]|uniref:Reverse transcriptase n=1 Tax=Penicillium alfredii TaxID=1506179 RepID=A0A9W9FS56_9EURO|nr:reverse transcriptase [Penicillium alfredii]KAJ5105304.1 reverse transcriptase [Penicillium alfredii]
MPPADSYLSRTLQSLTQSKIHELGKQCDAYESQKAEILAAAAQCHSQRDRVAQILAGTKRLFPRARWDESVRSIERWVDQARYDSTITPEKLDGFEAHLLGRLDAHSRKMSMADLYSRLLTEWISPPSKEKENTAGSPSDEEDFLVVDERQKERLKQLCDRFEATVFEPREADPTEITTFLNGLFPSEESLKPLEEMRETIRTRMTNIWEDKEPFDIASLSQCIKGLRNEDILSEEKQETLKLFLNSNVALTEIADVLNMRYADLRNWDWHAGPDGVPVLPRQQLNGKYRIWMDEDVLQTIFMEHICMRLCGMLKEVLKDFIRTRSVWTFHQRQQMDSNDRLRRQYYCGYSGPSQNVKNLRRDEFIDTYFLSQLPSDETSLADRGGGYDEDNEVGDQSTPPEARRSVKQELLRKIVTETLLQHRLHGQAAVVQSDLQWYATSLPHSTVFTILQFLGFPPEWVDFFRKYLETPLNMDKSFEGHEQTGPRKRRTGIPIAHASEKVIGELILFFMDLAVNRETGMLLYRLHDDVWLSGDPARCAQAWQVMQTYARVTGLQFNKSKSGSVCLGDSIDPHVLSLLPEGPVRIGFLMLDAASGRWAIDHSQVNAHVQQLKTQLEHCDSVISWVRTWNSCIGRFFKNTFGQPAYCFGRPHVDAILAAYEDMQKTILDTNGTHTQQTLTQHLREMIQARFDVSDIPDAFFFLPEELGGLGLRNPFISVLLVSNQLRDPPLKLIKDFVAEERHEYAIEKKLFDDLSKQARWKRLDNIHPHGAVNVKPVVSQREMDTFMSFEEYTRFREETSPQFTKLYQHLLQVPEPNGVELNDSDRVPMAVRDIRRRFRLKNEDPEMRWILYLYGEDLLSRFGGLNLVDKQFLPMGVLDMIKGKKVKWQMVL